MREEKNFLGLHNLQAPLNARKAPKRLGRGESSGIGKTCGKGHKGQKARKSGNVRIGFEGGQNPLARRLPKHGFKSMKSKATALNLASISERFEDNADINPTSLLAAGLIRNLNNKIKILGDGEPKKGYKIQIHGMSSSARKKVEDFGGKVEILK